MTDSHADVDPAGTNLARLLTDLANDPAAPPSTVTPSSVIAAARAAVADSTVPVVPAGDLAVRDDLAIKRAGRRRAGLIALVAAASVAGIAAVVIPLSLSGGSSTSTSADAGRVAAGPATSAPRLPQDAAALAVPSPEVPSLAAGQPEADGSADAGGADAGGAADGSAAAGGAAITCWPVLNDQASAALISALPPGAFGPPTPLIAACGRDPVGGAVLAGSSPGGVLVVRVSRAAPGECLGFEETAVRCAPMNDGAYVATDSAAGQTVFAYGNGYQVEVGGRSTNDGLTAVSAGLSADQLLTAARAVLGALE